MEKKNQLKYEICFLIEYFSFWSRSWCFVAVKTGSSVGVAWQRDADRPVRGGQEDTFITQLLFFSTNLSTRLFLLWPLHPHSPMFLFAFAFWPRIHTTPEISRITEDFSAGFLAP